jgi:hypothetical protein
MFESHAEDVWGIVLLTTAVLGALALYGDALGPVGQGLRHGLGDPFSGSAVSSFPWAAPAPVSSSSSDPFNRRRRAWASGWC